MVIKMLGDEIYDIYDLLDIVWIRFNLPQKVRRYICYVLRGYYGEH